MADSLVERIEEIICVSDIADDIVEAVGKYKSPDEVFSDSALADWAENNGYVKAD